MRPPSGETIGSSSDAVRGAVDSETSWISDEPIHTSSVERYKDNAGNQYQALDENYLLVTEATKAGRGQELSSTFNQGGSSPSPTPWLRDEGTHFSYLKNASPGSWEFSGGWKEGSPRERKVSGDSLDQSRNPFETLPNSPTPSGQGSNSCRDIGSPGSGGLSPICEDKKGLFPSLPRHTLEPLITRSISHFNNGPRQAPRDIPKGKRTSEGPESPGSGVFHFSPEEDSYNSLTRNNLIHIKGSQFNESPSMQREQQSNAVLCMECEILDNTGNGFESHGSPNFIALESPRCWPPGPLNDFRGTITNSRRKNWEPRYRQHSSTPEPSSSARQDLACNVVPSGHHSNFVPSPRFPDSSTLLQTDYQEDIKCPKPPIGSELAKLYTFMELLDDPFEEQENFIAHPNTKQDLGLSSSQNRGNTTISDKTSVKAHNNLWPREPDCLSTTPKLPASPHALSPGKGISSSTKEFINSGSNKLAVGEFIPNFVDKTEKQADLRRKIEGILNEPDNPRIRGSPLVVSPDTGAENPTLTALLSSASSNALQEALDFLSAQVEALVQENSSRGNLWSKYFPITSCGSIQYLPKDTEIYAFEGCSNLQKLIRCTAVFLDTLTGTSNSGFWAEPDLFITSLCFRERPASGHVMDYNPRMAPGNSRYFVSPSNTGMLEDRVPVLLKAWDTRSNLAIFQPASVGPGQQCHYEHIGIENLVEDHELLPTHSNQIYSNDSIAAVGYIHARPRLHESEPDDLAHRASYLRSNGEKDTRIRTVCSINQVCQFVEANHHTNSILKANCLFPQNFYGSPCVAKQSGFVIGVVNGPHSASNAGNINLFPRGFRDRLRWYTSKVGFAMVELL